jgi:hypothetical protein
MISQQCKEALMAQANTTTTTGNPRQRAAELAGRMRDLQSELRVGSRQAGDPKAQALFETLAEVLGGTMQALDDYRDRREPAWH